MTGLKAVSATESSITLSWDKSSGAQYYRLYEYVDEEFIFIDNVAATSYTVNKLSAGEHCFYVRAAADSTHDEEKGKLYQCTKWAIINASTAAPAATAVESAVASGDQVKITFNGQPVADGSCQVIVAGYDSNGKMIASNVAAVTGRIMDVELKNAASADHITVFVLDSKHKPLMESYTTP